MNQTAKRFKHITLGNFLFGAVKLHKNADQDRSNYRGYDIRFNPHLHSFHGQVKALGKCHYFGG